MPWDQNKYDKAKYFVSGTAMSSEYGWANHPTAYGKAMNLARKLKDDYDAVLQTYDAVIMPTLPQPARRHISPGAGPLEWANANRESSRSCMIRYMLTGSRGDVIHLRIQSYGSSCHVCPHGLHWPNG